MRSQFSHQLSFGDGFIDPALYKLDEELTKIDELLSDPELVRPFEEVFDPTLGRPATAVGVYVRMMYLKFRWGLSYEEVETEVRERLPWRYYCRLSLMDPVPDATTLAKLNQRFGEERIAEFNRHLIKQLVKNRSIKARKIRIGSGTVEAQVDYDGGIGLIHQLIKTLGPRAARWKKRLRSYVHAAKRALFYWTATKADPKQRKARE
jgi:IS5 family transposase